MFEQHRLGRRHGLVISAEHARLGPILECLAQSGEAGSELGRGADRKYRARAEMVAPGRKREDDFLQRNAGVAFEVSPEAGGEFAEQAGGAGREWHQPRSLAAGSGLIYAWRFFDDHMHVGPAEAERADAAEQRGPLSVECQRLRVDKDRRLFEPDIAVGPPVVNRGRHAPVLQA